MKKLLFFILANLSLIIASTQKPSFSVNGGLNLYCQNKVQDAVQESWDDYFQSVSAPERVTDIDKVTFIPGFNLGVSMKLPLNTNWMFRTGLEFNMKGGKAEGQYGTGGAKTSFSNKWVLGYLEIPVSFQYWVSEQFYLEIGPQIGYLLSAKATEEEEGYDTWEETGTNDYNKIEFSITGGGGYVLGQSGFGIFARYIHGLTKSYTHEEFYSNVRNSTGQFGFFYEFNKPPPPQ